MSVLIKGMEMPTSRPVCIVVDVAGQARRYDLNNGKYADDKLFEAIHVPPHGRLIDADEVMSRVDDGDDVMFVWAITDAPTIIPAEEEPTCGITDAPTGASSWR